MARAGDELRNWRRWGKVGNSGQRAPMRLLERQGYTLTKDWRWRRPSPAHVVTPEEADAIKFLSDEWDFGGLVD